MAMKGNNNSMTVNIPADGTYSINTNGTILLLSTATSVTFSLQDDLTQIASSKNLKKTTVISIVLQWILLKSI